MRRIVHDFDRNSSTLVVIYAERPHTDRTAMSHSPDHPDRLDPCCYLGSDLFAECKRRQKNETDRTSNAGEQINY